MLQMAARKLTSLLLIAIILAVSAFGLCQETHALEQAWEPAAHASTDASTVDAGDHCPACPEGGHQEADHCASSCYCSCHLPVTSQTVWFRYLSVIGDLAVFESFTALPQVYLPKFIPPQNLV